MWDKIIDVLIASAPFVTVFVSLIVTLFVKAFNVKHKTKELATEVKALKEENKQKDARYLEIIRSKDEQIAQLSYQLRESEALIKLYSSKLEAYKNQNIDEYTKSLETEVNNMRETLKTANNEIIKLKTENERSKMNEFNTLDTINEQAREILELKKQLEENEKVAGIVNQFTSLLASKQKNKLDSVSTTETKKLAAAQTTASTSMDAVDILKNSTEDEPDNESVRATLY